MKKIFSEFVGAKVPIWIVTVAAMLNVAIVSIHNHYVAKQKLEINREEVEGVRVKCLDGQTPMIIQKELKDGAIWQYSYCPPSKSSRSESSL